MISSINFKNKVRNPRFGQGLFLVLFAVSLSLAYGIGYRQGRGAVVHPSVSIASVSKQQPEAKRSANPDRDSHQSTKSILSSRGPSSSMVWTSLKKPTYTLYLASFQKYSDAERERGRLETKGLKGIVISERKIPGQIENSWYRLNYGRFDSQEAASEFGRQLTERGLIRDFWTKELG